MQGCLYKVWTWESGIVGVKLKPETLKTGALSHHICSPVLEDFENESTDPKLVTKRMLMLAKKATKNTEKTTGVKLIGVSPSIL